MPAPGHQPILVVGAGSDSDLEEHETIAAYARPLGQDGSWLPGR